MHVVRKYGVCDITDMVLMYVYCVCLFVCLHVVCVSGVSTCVFLSACMCVVNVVRVVCLCVFVSV